MSCQSDSDCPFLYHCYDTQCQHDSIFPLKVYPTVIYVLLPFACGVVNSTGHSMGIFRVLIVMNLLRYESVQATMITQAMVVGSAIPNFFSLIFRRHPELPSSLVNFNLIIILIPCSLIGSTLGSLLGSFIPEIGQDIIIIIAFTYFSWNFFVKYRRARKRQKDFLKQQLIVKDNELSVTGQQGSKALNNDQIPRQEQLDPRQIRRATVQSQKQNRQQLQVACSKRLTQRLTELQFMTIPLPKVQEEVNEIRSQKSQEERNSLQFQTIRNQSQLADTFRSIQHQKTIQENNVQIDLDCSEIFPESFRKYLNPKYMQDERYIQLMRYQSTIHLKDVLFSFMIFVIFEFLAFLVQGRLPFTAFSRCDWKYPVGLTLLIMLTLIYMFFVRKYMRKKFNLYDKYEIKQELSLNRAKDFYLIVFAGTVAGLCQGILGVGAGTCMMAVLLSTPLNTISATATSGFQILYIGLSALIEGFIDGVVKLEAAGFFIGICCVLGGIVTYVAVYFIERGNQLKLTKILILIIAILCVFSVIMVIPSIIVNIEEFGWPHMTKISFKC